MTTTGSPVLPVLVSARPLDLTSMRDVQRALNMLLGKGLVRFPAAIAEDGMMGLQTREAVQAFQQQLHLPVTGQLDESTLGMLVQALNSIGVSHTAAPAAGHAPQAAGAMWGYGGEGNIYGYGSGSAGPPTPQQGYMPGNPYWGHGVFLPPAGHGAGSAGTPMPHQPHLGHGVYLPGPAPIYGPPPFFAAPPGGGIAYGGATAVIDTDDEGDDDDEYDIAGYAAGQYSPESPDPLDKGVALANQMEGMLQQTEPGTGFGKISYTNVVAAYQNAGQFGADHVGPAIDAAGVPNATQSITQQAWTINQDLHTKIKTWGALGPGYSDMRKAKDMAWNMLNLYRLAISKAQDAQGAQLAQQVQQQLPHPRVPHTHLAAQPAQPAHFAQYTPTGPLTPAVQQAAHALIATIRATAQAGQPFRWNAQRAAHGQAGQATAMWRPTSNFQTAFNGWAPDYMKLKVDGIYGTATENALRSVVPNAVEVAPGFGQNMAAHPSAVAGAAFWGSPYSNPFYGPADYPNPFYPSPWNG